MKSIRVFFRKSLKSGVKRITRKVVQKHHIEIIAIVGEYGSQIAREALYSILDERYNVRRNVRPIWWDMSIPLTILGYDDKKYGVFGWLEIFVKSVGLYLKAPSYKHKIIIELNTESKDIAEYWGEFLNPNIILILNASEAENTLLTRIMNDKQTQIVYNSDEIKTEDFIDTINKPKIRFGIQNADVLYKYTDGELSVSFKGKTYEAKINLPEFEIAPVVGAISVAIVYENDIAEIIDNLIKFELHPHILDKIYQSI